MAENSITVCSARTCVAAQNKIEQLHKEHGYVVVSYRVGPLSSMPQKALVHIWFRQIMARVTGKAEDTITDDEIEDIKRSMKARYYHATGAPWMVHVLADPLAPSKKRRDYTSIARWGQGECFAFMEWLQLYCAERLGLVLESTGEHQKLKQKGNS